MGLIYPVCDCGVQKGRKGADYVMVIPTFQAVIYDDGEADADLSSILCAGFLSHMPMSVLQLLKKILSGK